MPLQLTGPADSPARRTVNSKQRSLLASGELAELRSCEREFLNEDLVSKDLESKDLDAKILSEKILRTKIVRPQSL